MLKAMIWKEGRENIKWAALVFGLVSLAMVRIGLSSLGLTPWMDEINPFSTMVLLVATFGPLLAGLVGYNQIAHELKRDQWALFIHRPASRSVLFAGKAIAGLSLYFLALWAPMFLLSLWAKSQHSLAHPFEWQHLLDATQLIFSDARYYFVGMLIALRPVRWYGSRLLPILGVMAIGWAVIFVPQGWGTTLVRILTFAIIVLAAWGSFLTDGSYPRQPRIARVALGTVLYSGLLSLTLCFASLFMVGIVVKAIVTLPDELTQSSKAIKKGDSSKTAKSEELLSESRIKHIMSSIGREPWFMKPAVVLSTPSWLVAYAMAKHEDDSPSALPAIASKKDLQTFLASTLAVGFLYSIGAFVVARRARLSQAEILGWCAANLVLGLSGLLLLLCLRTWPELEVCPTCEKKRRIDQTICEHCGTPHDLPTPDATAIFEVTPNPIIA